MNMLVKFGKVFEIKNLGEYHDLYLKTDVILLSNVFEAFREVCLKNYGLHPAHFYTAPGLGWKACLKKTKIRLELLLGPDMLLMFEIGIRGGITQSVHRWAKANNLFMGPMFNANEKTSYLQYFDTKNLHGWAMSQPLPTGKFKWVEVKPNKIRKLVKCKDKGYLIVKCKDKGYLIVFNNKKFLDYLKEIYPSQLTVEKANKSDHLADYLDLTFIIDSGGKLSTRLYDKRDDFDFHIVNFPFLSSNIPSGPSYGVYISQLIRYARCCSHYDDFRYRHKCLVDRLLSQGYKALRLEKSFKKFYGRYQDLIEKYRRSVNAMVSDSFPGQFLFNM